MNTTVDAATDSLKDHRTIPEAEWIEAGRELLAKEKELTRHRDDVSRLRRELPWTPIEENYVFESESGPVTLSDLFKKNDQLIVYHFMFAPGWDEGCSGCSFVSDHFDAARQHFEHHDVSFAAVSRAPLAEFLPFKKRMGWTFPWVSSAGTDFNYRFGVSFWPEEVAAGPVLYNFTKQKLSGDEQPGLTVFYKDGSGKIYRTYSTYERGLDLLVGAYNFLDLVPKGRNENSPMEWMKYHDRYED